MRAYSIVMIFCFAAPLFADLAKMKAEYRRPVSMPEPKDNIGNPARIKLGHLLFFEPRISRSGVMSCATCHNPSLGWEDGNKTGIGDKHQVLGRKSPTILNLAWADLLFWDGRAASLEEQALGPIEAQGEMNLPHDKAVNTLKSIKGYKKYFEAAYPGEGISTKTIGKAIAAYERTIVSGEAPFDRWLAGNEKAISGDAKKGFEVFNTKGKCASCHSGWAFTDHSFQDIGVNDKDVGRYKHLPLDSMKHAFKTPGLRNINQRQPYLHNGSEPTLEAVVEFYDRGGDSNRPSKSTNVTKLGLSAKEKKQLVAFLNTLTSKDKPVIVPILPQ